MSLSAWQKVLEVELDSLPKWTLETLKLWRMEAV